MTGKLNQRCVLVFMLTIVLVAASGCASKGDAGAPSGGTKEYKAQKVSYEEYERASSIDTPAGQFVQAELKRNDASLKSGVLGYVPIAELPAKVISADGKIKITINSVDLSPEGYVLIRGNVEAKEDPRYNSYSFAIRDYDCREESGMNSWTGTKKEGDFTVEFRSLYPDFDFNETTDIYLHIRY